MDSNKIRRWFQLAFEVVFETALSHALHHLAPTRPDRSASANGIARYSVFTNQIPLNFCLSGHWLRILCEGLHAIQLNFCAFFKTLSMVTPAGSSPRAGGCRLQSVWGSQSELRLLGQDLPPVIPAQAGTQATADRQRSPVQRVIQISPYTRSVGWIPACAGMT